MHQIICFDVICSPFGEWGNLFLQFVSFEGGKMVGDSTLIANWMFCWYKLVAALQFLSTVFMFFRDSCSGICF